LDVREVTVGAFRAAGIAHPPDGIVDYGDPRDSGGSVGITCTFSSTEVGTDDLPTNCLTWAKAHEYCLSVGRDLPTEAQFEYAASGLRGSTYVWGEEDPLCPDAVFARAIPRQPIS